MKRIFLIFLCLTLLGTLCACRVRLIADPAQADTILQAQQEAQPPQEEEPQPPAQEEPEPPEQESEAEPPAEETPPDTPPQPDETAQAEQPDTSVSVAQTGTAVYTEQLAAGVTVTYDPNGGDSATVSASVTPGQPYGAQPEANRSCRKPYFPAQTTKLSTRIGRMIRWRSGPSRCKTRRSRSISANRPPSILKRKPTA